MSKESNERRRVRLWVGDGSRAFAHALDDSRHIWKHEHDLRDAEGALPALFLEAHVAATVPENLTPPTSSEQASTEYDKFQLRLREIKMGNDYLDGLLVSDPKHIAQLTAVRKELYAERIYCLKASAYYQGCMERFKQEDARFSSSHIDSKEEVELSMRENYDRLAKDIMVLENDLANTLKLLENKTNSQGQVIDYEEVARIAQAEYEADRRAKMKNRAPNEVLSIDEVYTNAERLRVIARSRGSKLALVQNEFQPPQGFNEDLLTRLTLAEIQLIELRDQRNRLGTNSNESERVLLGAEVEYLTALIDLFKKYKKFFISQNSISNAAVKKAQMEQLLTPELQELRLNIDAMQDRERMLTWQRKVAKRLAE